MRNQVVAHLESRKIATRLLFGGNLTRQPALTALVKQCRVEGRPAPYRVAGDLTNTDAVMNRSFWFGVYPGLTVDMRRYMVETMRGACGR